MNSLKQFTPFILVCFTTFNCIAQNRIYMKYYELEGKYGFVNNLGDTISKNIYPSYYRIGVTEAECCLENRSKCGRINAYGQIEIPFVYDYVGRKNKQGYSLAKLEGKYGILSATNELVVPFEYVRIDLNDNSDITKDLIAVKKDALYGYINYQNALVIPYQYNEALSFQDGIAWVGDSARNFKLINAKNEALTPNIYAPPYMFSKVMLNHKIVYKLGDKRGLLNEDYTYFTEARYSIIFDYKDGYYPIILNRDTFGYLYASGEEVLSSKIPFDFDWQVKPPIIKDKSVSQLLFEHSNQKWSLIELLNRGLKTFSTAPQDYFHYEIDHLKSVCAVTAFNLDLGYYPQIANESSQAWLNFRNRTLFPIIASERMRQIIWSWAAPYYKTAFIKLNPMHKAIFRDMANYIKTYVNEYDLTKTTAFYNINEKEFARKDFYDNKDPYRKLSALIDRLIIKHKIITVKDAKIWGNKIANEVLAWD
jgi:hypothetical protein